MLPRNITLFRISAAVAADTLRLADVLPEFPLRECGPLELATSGFVRPAGDDAAPLVRTVRDASLLSVGSESKVLPPASIDRELRRKMRKIEEEEGRKVGARERRRLREDIQTRLLPNALVVPGRIDAWIDRTRGYVCIDTSSRKAAEKVVTDIREALGSFPAIPLTPDNPPRVVLTQWLVDGQLPDGMAIGEECELKDMASSKGAVWRGSRADLGSEEVKEHLRAGMQVTRLGLVFRDRLSFVLDDTLTIRKLKFLELAMEQAADDNREDAESAIDADLALTHGEVGALLDQLAETFGLTRPTDGDEVDHAVKTMSHGSLPFGPAVGPDESADDLELARAAVRESGKASISTIQRVLRIGYNRAARLLEQLEQEGFVSPPLPSGHRELRSPPQQQLFAAGRAAVE